MIPYCWPQRRPQPKPPAPETADPIQGHLLRIISLLEELVRTAPQGPQQPPHRKPAITPGYMQELKAKLGQRNQTPSSSR